MSDATSAAERDALCCERSQSPSVSDHKSSRGLYLDPALNNRYVTKLDE